MVSGAPRIIPDDLLLRQIEASDPAASAWVAANAGSGKTHVLAQRVIRLLLEGVDPARILCITFTKAAAANMANRVFGELATGTYPGQAWESVEPRMAATWEKIRGQSHLQWQDVRDEARAAWQVAKLENEGRLRDFAPVDEAA